jgi:tryptophanyl-tRNA synthetase
MRTDPARVRRNDPGNPDVCPVFSLHEIYSTSEVKSWAAQGCRSAGIGCVDCKGPLIDSINAEQAPIRERAGAFENDPDMLRSILQEGSERARDTARETLEEVRGSIGILHR